MPHVVSAVAVGLQRARHVTLVVNNVNTNHVAIAKSAVVNTCYGQLLNLTGQVYAIGTTRSGTVAKQVVRTSRKRHCACEHIYINVSVGH